MTRFDSCGTYQVSERSVAVFFTGNDLVSERVDLLTHLPAIHSRRIRFHRRFEDSRLCWPSRSGRGILFNCYLRNFARTVRVEFRGSARNLNILPSIISSLLLRQSSPFISYPEIKSFEFMNKYLTSVRWKEIVHQNSKVFSFAGRILYRRIRFILYRNFNAWPCSPHPEPSNESPWFRNSYESLAAHRAWIPTEGERRMIRGEKRGGREGNWRREGEGKKRWNKDRGRKREREKREMISLLVCSIWRRRRFPLRVEILMGLGRGIFTRRKERSTEGRQAEEKRKDTRRRGGHEEEDDGSEASSTVLGYSLPVSWGPRCTRTILFLFLFFVAHSLSFRGLDLLPLLNSFFLPSFLLFHVFISVLLFLLFSQLCYKAE